MPSNPRQPSEDPTGSRARIETYRARYFAGLPLHNPLDTEDTIPQQFDVGAKRPSVPGIKQCRSRCAIPAE